MQLKELGKGRREGGGAPVGELGISEEELRAQHKRRMLFGQAHPRSAAGTPTAAPTAAPVMAAAAASAAAATAAQGDGGSAQDGTAGVSPRAAAAAGAAATAAVAAAQPGLAPLAAALHGAAAPVSSGASAPSAPSGGSGPSSPARQSVDEVAAAGAVFAPLTAGPLGSGLASDDLEPFGSSTLVLPEAPEPGSGQAAADVSVAGRAPPAPATEAQPMPQPPRAGAFAAGSSGSSGGSAGGRAHMSTPRWAKQLASKAQKGLHKLRDSLQD